VVTQNSAKGPGWAAIMAMARPTNFFMAPFPVVYL
jgi:hypothetical protein